MTGRVRAWFWRPVNARAFGADPTGAADSTAAIQAALAKAASRMGWVPDWLWLPRFARRFIGGRRTVFVPAGTYAVSVENTVPPSTALRGGR